VIEIPEKKCVSGMTQTRLGIIRSMESLKLAGGGVNELIAEPALLLSGLARSAFPEPRLGMRNRAARNGSAHGSPTGALGGGPMAYPSKVDTS
jgi:hypothetical protein